MGLFSNLQADLLGVDVSSFTFGFLLSSVVFGDCILLFNIVPAFVQCVKAFILKLIERIPDKRRSDHA